MEMVNNKSLKQQSGTALLGQDNSGNINPASILFPLLTRLCGNLLSNDPDEVLSEKSIRRRQKYMYPLFQKLGPLFLNGKKLIRERIAPLPEGDRPLIFAPNHGFLEDAISTILVSDRHAYLLFGSLPQFYNTFNGLAAYLNGSVVVNRNDRASKRASVEKAVRLLELGGSLILYPEGVWNKTANRLTLDYWPGILRIARRTNALIVPIVHYLTGSEIHTSRLAAFDVFLYAADQEADALRDLQTMANTELMALMEQYGQTHRSDILGDHASMADAAEEIVRAQVATAGKYYDYAMEISADYRRPGITTELEVWASVANLELTPDNAGAVLYARERVATLGAEDYQHRF